ncbi:MAG TPA: phosphoribosylanthranilate isomerase [Terriglobales bacterium]|jgi:phosphoribosylanthranilate isomerase|nr:phosphoribosylanthranilate isomerase [Terriglobales bacterium]
MSRNLKNMVWVKICGTTNLEDAQTAVDAGADALGFVFAESPRRVAPVVARQITRALPGRVEKIGVFVKETAQHIREIAAEIELTGVQIHGDEDLEVALSLIADPGSSRPLDVIPVLPIGRFGQVMYKSMQSAGRGSRPPDILIKFMKGHRLILDTAVEGKWGGSGQTWDWKLGKASVQFVPPHCRTIIAGGLTPANVGEAIRTLHAWGVDVASGVEREPGKKDLEKVREFVNAAKSTDPWADFRHLMRER